MLQMITDYLDDDGGDGEQLSSMHSVMLDSMIIVYILLYH